MCTKFGNRIYGNKITQDFSSHWLWTCFNESCQRLNTNRIDVMLLHSPPPDFNWQKYDRSLLEKLVDQGRIGAYGVSCRTVDCAKRVIKAKFGSVLEVIYNLVDQRARRIFDLPNSDRYSFVVKSPLAYGLVTRDPDSKFGRSDHRSQLDHFIIRLKI